MKEGKQAVERLRKVLMRDKIQSYEGVARVLEDDLFGLLSCYFGLKREDLEVKLSINDNGRYSLNCSLEADSIISPQVLENNYYN